jgi:sodium transport system permease protein
MTWSILRTIWLREVRDLARDRRTVVMIFALPAFLYPLMGFVGYEFARGAAEQESIVGISGLENLPALGPKSDGFSPIPAASWLAATPTTGLDGFAGAAALVQAARVGLDYPPLIVDLRVPDQYWDNRVDTKAVQVVPLPGGAQTALQDRRVDVLLVVPADLVQHLDGDGRTAVEVYSRADERSRLAERRLMAALTRWKERLKEVRLLHHRFPADFDNAVTIRSPQHEQEPAKRSAEELAELVARYFPFMLIMWSMAGALYPAIDVCAGEKERGTLETLLLSPASRADIVTGKFLAVWVFSSLTALWNLLWMGGGTYLAHAWLPFPILTLSGLAWCAGVTLLLSALFSAVSLALGAYARSTKEGQYYLMPLFLVTLPLTFLPLLPGVELNFFYGLVPITGATLLLQRLMLGGAQPIPWLYFVPVLASLAVSVALALRWAVAQFEREDVLFRSGARLELGTALRRLFRRE